ncbi:hypothetical protein [Janibacter anophelis]|uniref:hypothetical protein n=1 Tax=Janibacter anophelis TaxID=319054 RepID=UPI000A94E715|nr:hypothetical protein [Janibacter anophelis]
MPRRGLLASVLSALLLAVLLVPSGNAAAIDDEFVPVDRYVVGGCRIAFDAAGTASPVGSAGRPCVGVSSLGVDNRGDLIVRMTPQAPYPSLRIMVQAGPVLSARGIATSATGNGKHVTVRFYDARDKSRISLRSTTQRRRVVRADLVIGWVKVTPSGTTAASLLKDPGYDALGAYRDRTATSETTIAGGCVIRFDSETPRVHANGTHRCIGASSLRLSPTGDLQVLSSGEQRGAVVNAQADPDETLAARGLITGVTATPSVMTVSIYDSRWRRRLDLRQPRDYARVKGVVANMWVSWTKTTQRPGVTNAVTTAAAQAYGPYIDGSVEPVDLVQRGCRVRFTTKEVGVLPYGNRYHLCTGVTGLEVNRAGQVVLHGPLGGIVSTTTIATSGQTDHGLRAGLSGGGARSTINIYSLELGRRLDLRSAADRRIMVSDGAELYPGWTHFIGSY